MLTDAATETRLLSIMRSAARAVVLPRFRALEAGQISTKSGPTDLVTIADTEAEAMMTAAIAQAWPAALVLGEEAVAADPALRHRIAAADLAVILDPVDGTWNFAHGLALFGMILAVTVRGRPVLGLIYDPILDDALIVAETGPARMVLPDGSVRVLRTRAPADLGRMQGYFPIGLFAAAERARLASLYGAFARLNTLRCAAHEYRMLAQGYVDFCVSGPAPHPWDHAAGALAVIRAGGVARFLDGAPYDAGRGKGVFVAAASEPVWDKVAAELRSRLF